MMSYTILDGLCNDIKTIIHRLLHEECLIRCFQEIHKQLQWDDELCCFVDAQNRYERANWRQLKRKLRGNQERIYEIWGVDVVADLPHKY